VKVNIQAIKEDNLLHKAKLQEQRERSKTFLDINAR
jgi:hypothetical protein